MNLQDYIIPVQQKLGLLADGVAGEKTWKAISDKLGTSPQGTQGEGTQDKDSEPQNGDLLDGLRHNDWPKEAEAEAFFGYPPNLTSVIPPYAMHMDDDKITKITCNLKVAASLRRILSAIWDHYNHDVAKVAAVGLDAYDGMYNDRNVRGSHSKRSMHAYGAAIDIDAEHNPLGASHGRMPEAVVAIFKAEGWRWGGDYLGRKDWMHFEACV